MMKPRREELLELGCPGLERPGCGPVEPDEHRRLLVATPLQGREARESPGRRRLGHGMVGAGDLPAGAVDLGLCFGHRALGIFELSTRNDAAVEKFLPLITLILGLGEARLV